VVRTRVAWVQGTDEEVTAVSIPSSRDEAPGQLPIRCPTCGRGELVDISYNQPADASSPSGEPVQEADSRQVVTYSCGHEVIGPRIDREQQAGPALDVERRTSEETVPPPDAG
jgi:uncharacterized protein (DUF983 family)